ncbi:hypothetical protein JZ751_007974 [Albula glossodonta]|uniref:Uncharacterized protein n=1 Tax=Albula glossodonta TaxID=121402 RepID=A0A8T2P351_9TELE|nr:hypothetical protein JZ751_007974 [Albula glossodonta]
MTEIQAEEGGGSLPAAFLSRFPALIKVQVSGKVTGPCVAKSMMGCLLDSLKTTGSSGAFCVVRQSNVRMLDLYRELGRFEEVKVEGVQKEFLVMGRTL